MKQDTNGDVETWEGAASEGSSVTFRDAADSLAMSFTRDRWIKPAFKSGEEFMIDKSSPSPKSEEINKGTARSTRSYTERVGPDRMMLSIMTSNPPPDSLKEGLEVTVRLDWVQPTKVPRYNVHRSVGFFRPGVPPEDSFDDCYHLYCCVTDVLDLKNLDKTSAQPRSEEITQALDDFKRNAVKIAYRHYQRHCSKTEARVKTSTNIHGDTEEQRQVNDEPSVTEDLGDPKSANKAGGSSQSSANSRFGTMTRRCTEPIGNLWSSQKARSKTQDAMTSTGTRPDTHPAKSVGSEHDTARRSKTY